MPGWSSSLQPLWVELKLRTAKKHQAPFPTSCFFLKVKLSISILQSGESHFKTSQWASEVDTMPLTLKIRKWLFRMKQLAQRQTVNDKIGFKIGSSHLKASAVPRIHTSRTGLVSLPTISTSVILFPLPRHANTSRCSTNTLCSLSFLCFSWFSWLLT